MTGDATGGAVHPGAEAASAIAAQEAEGHATLGLALLRGGHPAEALVSLRGAVAFGDRRPGTLLNLALAEDMAGDAVRAHTMLRELAVAMPGWDEPPLRLGESLRRTGRLAEAEAEYERALERNPQRPEALLSLAALLMLRQQAARAQMLLLRCCSRAPDRPDAWDALGLSLMMTGDVPAAESAFAEAQRLAPQHIDIAVRRAEAAAMAGSAAEELARLEVASAEDPANVALLSARGLLLGKLGRRDEAVEVLEAAVALAPEEMVPTVALANALTVTSRAKQAAEVLKRAVELAPRDSNLRNNYAATLVRVYRYGEAQEILEGLLAEQGPQLNVLCNLTNALVSMGMQQEGVARAQEAVRFAPQAHLAWRSLGNAMAYHPAVTGVTLLEAYQGVGRTLPRTALQPFANTPDPERRLRLGLLSPTLKTHPVGWLTIAGFETLDPDAFEIVCLGQPEANDPIERRFRALAGGWHVVDTEPPEALATRIRDLGIDILVELSGFGDRGLIAACAHRPAPVQVKWVGMQNHSTGLAEMDWMITDRWETPEGFEHFYQEKLLRMPDGYVCYSPPPYAPDVVPLPALSRGQVTFGCFNNTAKITPVVIATWARVLQAVPGSRLVLKAHQFGEAATCARFHSAFAAQGIAPERIELRAGSPHRQLLSQYNEIDVVLDPFPYSGGLTTCEALWMGVPTVSVPGETFASRHSASHMSNAGLQDWVVADLDAYVARAVAAVSDLPGLATLRAGLREQVRTSPLCDAPRFGRNLGTALRHTWRAWCAEQAG